MGRLFAFEIVYRGIFQKTPPSTSVAPPDAQKVAVVLFTDPEKFFRAQIPINISGACRGGLPQVFSSYVSAAFRNMVAESVQEFSRRWITTPTVTHKLSVFSTKNRL